MTNIYKKFLIAEKKLNPKFPSDLFIDIKDDMDFLDRFFYLQERNILGITCEADYESLYGQPLLRFYHMVLEESEDMKQCRQAPDCNIKQAERDDIFLASLPKVLVDPIAAIAVDTKKIRNL